MKAVSVVYNEAIDEEVMEAFSRAGLEHYTKFTRVLGSGPGSGARLDDHVWPGANRVLLVFAEEEWVSALVREIGKLRESLSSEGLRAFWWEIEGSV